MHQVLRVDELIRNISHCVDSTSTGTASLLAFASCCRSFEGPVMDVLWRRQVDIRTILKTLPADSWAITGQVFSLSRNLSRDEWDRFKIYTARVITLGIPAMNPGFLWGGPQAWVSVETLQLLWMESQRGEFWPGVRSLKSNISWEVAPFISLFLTPMITNLDLTLPRESNRLLQPTLSLLANTCHQLQSLVMSANSSSPLAGIEMGLLISASRDTLRRVEIRSFTPPDVFPVIFSLPRLQDLTLQELKFPNQIPPEVLPRLQAISLNGSDGPNLTQFLGAVSAPGLTALAIFHRGTVQLSPLLESLRGASTTMNTLYILPSAPFDHSSITILRSFTSLTSLTIGCGCEDLRPSGPCSFQLTDEDVQELGEALPRVRHLRLAPGCREPRQVTFRSLVWLSRTCSALGNLAIRVDFTNIADNSDQPDRDAPIQGANNGRPLRAESPLTALTVGNSPLPDIPSCEWMVALALVTVFPSIRFISSYRTENMHVRWEEVQEDILVCKKIFRVAGTNPYPQTTRRFSLATGCVNQ